MYLLQMFSTQSNSLSLWFDITTTRTDIGKARKKMFAKTNNELLISPTVAALEEHVKGQPEGGLPAPEVPVPTRWVRTILATAVSCRHLP